MIFRYDINGLRAVAVLLVVFYHFSVPGFSGGYVGVDVFFVISGYLMGQIICGRCEQGGFNFWAFYVARFRRIFPALIFLTLVVLLWGAFMLLPSEYELLGLHAASSLMMFSNIVYWRESGYFDSDALDKWLLHTWSLSAEWQFYLFIPVVIVFAVKWRSGCFLRPVLWLGLTISFALCVFSAARYEVASFYLLPMRAWEFLIGALLFLYSSRWRWLSKPFVSYLGLLLILTCSALYTKELTYPSFWALFPVLGAALVIGGTGNVLLNNGAFQFLGRLSYSLYLWHWPALIAFVGFGVALDFSYTFFLLACSLGMAILSFYFVEEPFRRLSTIRLPFLSRRVGYATILLMSWFIALACAMLVYVANGIPGRVSSDVALIASEVANENPRREECFRPSKMLQYPECRLGRQSLEPDVVFWGDSHSDAAFTGFSEAAERAERGGIYYGRSGCGPTLSQELLAGGDEADLSGCLQYNKGVFSRVSNNPSVKDVYLLARWSAEKYEKGKADFSGLACDLVAAGKRVYVVAPIPVYTKNIPLYFSRGLMRGMSLTQLEEGVMQLRSEYLAQNKFAFKQFSMSSKCGVEVLDPLPYLCPENVCVPLHGGLPVYFDNGHLSERGSRLLVPMFYQSLRRK